MKYADIILPRGRCNKTGIDALMTNLKQKVLNHQVKLFNSIQTRKESTEHQVLNHQDLRG